MTITDIIISIAINLISDIIFLIIIDKYNKESVKKRIIEDFRTEEIISETLLFENTFLVKLLNKREIKIIFKDKNLKNKKRVILKIIDFFEGNKTSINILIDIITSEKSNILYEMIDKAFYIFNNFKLLSISNHLKNRKSNFKENVIYNIENTEDINEKYEKIRHVILDILYFYYYFNELVEELDYVKKYEKKLKKIKDDKYKENITKIILEYEQYKNINIKINDLIKMK